ncbi:MAG TPA: GTPase [Pirellulales bacterium]|jgi:tRNA modification GTPase|nr:GTPase [Pirellulales bacterium]
MHLHVDDTIAAIATGAAGAARGIVRISGPHALACVNASLERGGESTQIVRLAERSTARPSVVAGTIARAPADFYIWPGIRSYTRQPTVEIHTFGSSPLLQTILAEVCRTGARVAQPGEFTLRAFLAGRLDLPQAEAVLGVIDARGESDLRAALDQLAGGLSRPLHRLRSDLLDLLAELEAGLDFAEEDLQFISAAELERRLRAAAGEIDCLRAQMRGRTDAGDAFRVVLFGAPNAGKSSLFNALVGHGAAIVAELAGTTRDYLSARVSHDGVLIEWIDTAGIDFAKVIAPNNGAAESVAKESDATERIAKEGDAAGDPAASSAGTVELGSAHAIDKAAQAQSTAQHERADLAVLCLDSSRPRSDWEQAARAECGAAERRLVVFTKVDQATAAFAAARAAGFEQSLCTSSRTGAGVRELADCVAARSRSVGGERIVASTAARCRESLEQASEALVRSAALVAPPGQEALIASEVRVALAELAKMAGAVYTDDLLDRIFSQFCIGK